MESNYFYQDLQRKPYRQVQKMAKDQKLPSNYKKIHLMGMLVARRNGQEDEVLRIIEKVKEERLQLCSTNRRVQRFVVSSTSEGSPTQPTTADAAPGAAGSSDRVLRSLTRAKPNYCLMNDPVLAEVEVPEDQRQTQAPRPSTSSYTTYNEMPETQRDSSPHIYTKLNRSDNQGSSPSRSKNQSENPGRNILYDHILKDQALRYQKNKSLQEENKRNVSLSDKQEQLRTVLKNKGSWRNQENPGPSHSYSSQPPIKRRRIIETETIPAYENTHIKVRRPDGKIATINAVVRRAPKTNTKPASTTGKSVDQEPKQITFRFPNLLDMSPQNRLHLSGSRGKITVQDIINSNIDRDQTSTNANGSVINNNNVAKDKVDMSLNYPNMSAYVEEVPTNTGGVRDYTGNASANAVAMPVNVCICGRSKYLRDESTSSEDLKEFIEFNMRRSAGRNVNDETESMNHAEEVRSSTAVDEAGWDARAQAALPPINAAFPQIKGYDDHTPQDIVTAQLMPGPNGNEIVALYTGITSVASAHKWTSHLWNEFANTTSRYCIAMRHMLPPTRKLPAPVIAPASANIVVPASNIQATPPQQYAQAHVSQTPEYDMAYVQQSNANAFYQPQAGTAQAIVGQYAFVDPQLVQPNPAFAITGQYGFMEPMDYVYANMEPNPYSNMDASFAYQQNNDINQRYNECVGQYFDGRPTQDTTETGINLIDSTTNTLSPELDVDNCSMDDSMMSQEEYGFDGRLEQYDTDNAMNPIDSTSSFSMDDINLDFNHYLGNVSHGMDQLDSARDAVEQNNFNSSIDKASHSSNSRSPTGSQCSLVGGSQYSAHYSQVVEPGTPSRAVDFDIMSADSQLSECDDNGVSNQDAAEDIEIIPHYLMEKTLQMPQFNHDMDIILHTRMQCVLCSWAGPKMILEGHIRRDHSDQIISKTKSKWALTWRLGSLFNQNRWLTRVVNYKQKLYAVSVKFEDPDVFMVNLSIITAISETHTGIITLHNHVTHEPLSWQGPVNQIDNNMPHDVGAVCLKAELSKLQVPYKESGVNQGCSKLQITAFVTITS